MTWKEGSLKAAVGWVDGSQAGSGLWGSAGVEWRGLGAIDQVGRECGGGSGRKRPGLAALPLPKNCRYARPPRRLFQSPQACPTWPPAVLPYPLSYQGPRFTPLLVPVGLLSIAWRGREGVGSVVLPCPPLSSIFPLHALLLSRGSSFVIPAWPELKPSHWMSHPAFPKLRWGHDLKPFGAGAESGSLWSAGEGLCGRLRNG